ncbi:MAG TPA: FtsQ-type POTRA domain-containing protein [Candidatus Dormibacteraeota bacterium]|nr:FtsQ-type POTRA domain-containing protein [Candidatus Dormibacteraeota bacterium]
MVINPRLAVASLQVQGASHVTQAELQRASGLSRHQSIFLVDGGAVGRRLAALPWIRTAQVRVQLPDSVQVSVEEWTPVATYQPIGVNTPTYYLSPQGEALGVAPSTASLLAIRGPGCLGLTPGRSPIDSRTLTALVNIQRGFPDLFKQVITSYQIGSDGSVFFTTARGWQGSLGRVITPEDIDALTSKLASLKSYSAKQDLNGLKPGQILYLEDPLAVAVGPVPQATPPSSSPRASASPTIGSSPQPSRPASPNPTPSSEALVQCL